MSVGRAGEDALADTNDVWADQPSRGYVQHDISASQHGDGGLEGRGSGAEPTSGSGLAPSLMKPQFDDFDPFRPDSGKHDDTSGSGEDNSRTNTLGVADDVRSDDERAPPTPSKPAFGQPPALPGKQAAATSTHLDSGDTSSRRQSADITGGTATPSTSAAPGILSNIAAAFKKRDHYATGSSSSNASPSTSRVATPAKPQAKPSLMLVRDSNDPASADMDDSEKSAMPAVPSNGPGSSAHDGNDADGEGGPDFPPFDFNLFLEQMRARPAEPIAKYLRSFLKEFGKRTWGVSEQIRVINDYLDFIAVKMRENEVWKSCSEKEFDNAVEAMEKLVMNRVYHLTFIPALPSVVQATTQTDDLERDNVLSQRIKLFGWVSEQHLDLAKSDDSDSFLDFARQELLKVNNYKAPRDKLICILNSCKVIFGLMRHLGTEDGADTFIPFLILVVLRANPPHLISNVQYIQRFRNPERLAGENGYYLSSLNGAISFIETLASSSLSNITEAEFESNVERAIATLPAEEDQHAAGPSQTASHTANMTVPGKNEDESPSPSLLSAPKYGPQRSLSPAEATRDFITRSSDNLQKTVSKPLQALGKIFGEMGSDSDIIAGVPGAGPPQRQQQSAGAGRSPHRQRSGGSISSITSPRSRRGYVPQPVYGPPPGAPMGSPYDRPLAQQIPPHPPVEAPTPMRPGYNPADYLDDSISAEQVQAEADRQQKVAFDAKIETLAAIFPGIERETLEIVLVSHGEEVERAIEALLEMG